MCGCKNGYFEEFNNFLGDYIRKNKKTDEGILYHYTGVENLANFFGGPNERCDIFGTHCSALNDYGEVSTGMKVAIDVLKEMSVSDEICGKLLKDLENTKFDYTRTPFVFSLCSLADSLSQWRMYTNPRQGGYAIGFSQGLVADAVATINRECGHRVLFCPCFYIGVDDIDAIIRKFIDVFSILELLKGNAVQYCSAVDLLRAICTFVKDGGFKDESEWRLAGWYGNSQLADLNFLGMKPRMRTGIGAYLMSPRALIEELIVSPHGEQGILMSLAYAMRSKSQLMSLRIRQSTLTYIVR